MKKYFLISLLLLALLGCSNEAEYDTLMSNGLDALEAEDVQAAEKHFKQAQTLSNSFEPEHYLELITLANNFNAQMKDNALDQAELTLNTLMMKDKHELVDFLIKDNKDKLINK